MGKIIGMSLAVFGAILAMSWVTEGNDFFLYKVFAPRQEAVRREVFENTPSYTQGMIQEFENLEVQYDTATAEGRDSICSVVRHRAAAFPDAQIPGHLRRFVSGCRGGGR